MHPPWMPWKWCMGGGTPGTVTQYGKSVLLAAIVFNIPYQRIVNTAPTAAQRWTVVAMTDKELDLLLLRLTNARERKKDIALAKAHAEIDTIRREYEAYWDGVYDAIKEVKNMCCHEEVRADNERKAD